ncbi:MAG: alpha/beta hydrolase [Gemmatales bacterium]|nr:alpha/beta hydrolase [Gemmatales bacterium]MCS7161068.1 alpha/beta hydrolase [Gemmatales bacterium]MDW8176271.1 alpha/beta hydrolase [Gemmatales bacterium]MDW8222961.1 alpha/beta hydrolase [Gemmatales bacterium]
MWNFLQSWRRERKCGWRRLPVLVLINGLAEQSESWYCNRSEWQRDFDVKLPEILVYDGPQLQQRIAQNLPITVPYLTECLEEYLHRFVQKPPYYLVASSLGCQIAVELAVRRPGWVKRMVLLCPSGFGSQERLPIVEGVRSNNAESLVRSVFHDPRHVDRNMLKYFQQRMQQREWKLGVLRTVRGTTQHCVRDQLPKVSCPTLVICGQQDQIVCPREVEEAIRDLPQFQYVLLPKCGHAPQIERSKLVNRLVRSFLLSSEVCQPANNTAREPALVSWSPQVGLGHALG